MIIPGPLVAYASAITILVSVIYIVFLTTKEVKSKKNVSSEERHIQLKFTKEKIVACVVIILAVSLLW